MRISYSATQTYMRCHLQWHYRYVEGLERLTKAPPLITGELAHQALSCFYSTPTSARSQELLNHYLEDSYNDWLNANETRLALYPEELVKAEGARRRAAAMLKDYAAFAQVHDTFTVIATEAKLNFPWHDFEVGFAADGLIEQEGVRYLLEHKTTALYNPQSYQTDWQMPLYIWFLNEMRHRRGVQGGIARQRRKEWEERSAAIKEKRGSRCEVCGAVSSWESPPVIHHLNEDTKDNREENLLIVCYSCHDGIHQAIARRRAKPLPQWRQGEHLER